MTRPSRAVVDLAALRNNYRIARRAHGGRMLAVLKANAYGHGAVRCAQALQAEADGFAVAFGDEALQLREAGITRPILVLEGAFDAAELQRFARHDLWTVVHHEAQVRAVQALPADTPPLQVWIELDSGMHRAGLPLSNAGEVHARLQRSAAVAGLRWMTHFARADEPSVETTAEQVEAFDAAVGDLPGERSLCNSAGMLAWPAARRDWGRCGIALYGADPLTSRFATPELRPVMTFESEVFAERLLAPGDRLGYGGGFVATAPMRVGLVAAGYADGYPRVAPAGTPVQVGAHRTRLAGRVSMDMLTVDLTGLPDVGIGSRVELWGRDIDVNVVAQGAGTISYELLCSVKRVPRMYVDEA